MFGMWRKGKKKIAPESAKNRPNGPKRPRTLKFNVTKQKTRRTSSKKRPIPFFGPAQIEFCNTLKGTIQAGACSLSSSGNSTTLE
jgi:hypothetical protein